MPALNNGAVLTALFGRTDSKDSGIGWGTNLPVNVSMPVLGGKPVLLVQRQDNGQTVLQRAVSTNLVWSATPRVRLLRGLTGKGNEDAHALLFDTVADAEELTSAVEAASGQQLSNEFDRKTDKGSSELYFHYYGMLMHQQNMLQDYTRTGTYYAAILENRPDFEGKVVMDVGAGSGILSLFAAQAGARKVYAMEASGMAKFARQLADNSAYRHVVDVVHSKVEEAVVPERVDVLVSEPMGTLLVNERMLETYLYARDHFLKPGGKMFPQIGRIHVAAFSDEALYSEVAGRAAFWLQPNFYGVDVSPLHTPALSGYFSQVVVDAFDPSVLKSNCATRVFDFGTCTEAELQDISIPLNLQITQPCVLHGLACWFDVMFNGSVTQRYLSTAPGLPTTHWFQLRCVLQQPVVIAAAGSVVTGELRLEAHSRQSYDVTINLQAPPLPPSDIPQRVSCKLDLKEPYYRQLTTWYQQQPPSGDQQQQPGTPGTSQHSEPGGQPPPPPQQGQRAAHAGQQHSVSAEQAAGILQQLQQGFAMQHQQQDYVSMQHGASGQPSHGYGGQLAGGMQQQGFGGQQQGFGGQQQQGFGGQQAYQQGQGFGGQQASGLQQQGFGGQQQGFGGQPAGAAHGGMQHHGMGGTMGQPQGYGAPHSNGGGLPLGDGRMPNGGAVAEPPVPAGSPHVSSSPRQQHPPLAVMLAQQQQLQEASMRGYAADRHMQHQAGRGYMQHDGPMRHADGPSTSGFSPQQSPRATGSQVGGQWPAQQRPRGHPGRALRQLQQPPQHHAGGAVNGHAGRPPLSQ